MSTQRRELVFAAVFTAVLACSCGQPPRTTAAGALDLNAAVQLINPDDLMKHITRLSSDEFGGRAPGTEGERLTVNYLINQFKAFGLQPGNPDGTYVQNVPLVGLTAKPSVQIAVAGKTLQLRFPADYVALTRRVVPNVAVKDSEVVFVGYGVVAPEYQWDDYKGVDVRGKTIVMLVNDPAVPSPADSSKLDDNMFKGRAMTYYGRWTYKYEIAAKKGAAAAIIVHETEPAGYPYDVVSASWGRENFEIRAPDRNMDRVAVEGWIHADRAREVFKEAGLDFDRLKRAATRKDFRPVPLPAKATFNVTNTIRDIDSQNVVARLEGSDPQLRGQYVIYTAHWDHLGRDSSLEGDQIFNGALDNASGTAGLLEIARAYARLNPAPSRSMLFLSVTAEEFGLLGAKYYATVPLYPLENTLATINMDGLNQWGRTKDIVVVGHGNSTLDDVLTQVASAKARTVVPDAEPEKGFFYRSDHFEFAKQGVPSLYTDSGIEYIGKPEAFGRQKRDEYTARDYHKVSDEVKPDWDMSGAVEDLQLLFEVGYGVAQGVRYPEWKPNTEFKAQRDEMMKKAGAR
jgi:Zn-dependent M28 family amino/carboxypeptidase